MFEQNFNENNNNIIASSENDKSEIKSKKIKRIILILVILVVILILIITLVLVLKNKDKDEPNQETVQDFVVKGIFIDTENFDKLRIRKGFILVENGIIKSFKETNPNESLKLYDYSDKLILPGLIDLHLHAPQYPNCGIGLDLKLLDWLYNYTFPEESKYSNLTYAKKNYELFVNDLAKTGTTRAVIFATIHNEATLLLMDLLEEKKIFAYVGKVSMDRNSPDYYIETNGAENTEKFIEECLKRNYQYVRPIITPRFTPSVSDSYMEELGLLAKKYNLSVQSHLSESKFEIELVKELRPNDSFYAESYDKYGLFGKEIKTVMAHCVHSPDEENDLIKKNGVFIAHCPTSNLDLSSGISPAKKYVNQGYNIGLGSDVSGGHSLDLFEVMKYSIEMSKLRNIYIDTSQEHITLSEALYMATNKGGSFFGKVGIFENDYEFDAIVLDESLVKNYKEFTESERLERFIYNKNAKIEAKFIKGNKLF